MNDKMTINQILQEQADYGRLDMNIEQLSRAYRHGLEHSGNYTYSEMDVLFTIKQIMAAKAWFLYYRQGTR